MESKSSFFILIGVIAFLSLTIALLTGYILLGGSPDPVDAEDPEDEIIIVPREDELIRRMLFEEKTPFNLKSEDSERQSVIVVSMEISYYEDVDGIRDTTEKVEANISKLQEIVGTYFQNLTIDEVVDVDAKETARNKLTALMNEHLLRNEETNDDIIYTIVFDQWFYQ
ncbi:flagellar basal body-associated FliL family protein [Herbivorax sp. ANBcel31]|uniref:flagellar basal body-associated FliL family protein n=1 Tax=Herbivorax sp. ANBcel31 TaxID=3069754 RepID=UPI0027B04BFE|nr:flagellar basal body-associated FliL family protein [Herbivorax sp. ANBcel31]MDQ2085886.1 flagellar basal body-associated FliL family protein [Herbivorax sp. ANBcel31]